MVDWGYVIAIGVPSIISAWASLRNGTKADATLQQLQPNGGHSFRDEFNKFVKIVFNRFSVQDDALAAIHEGQVERAKKIEELSQALEGIRQEQREAKARIDEATAIEKKLDVKLARYIIHEANNTLHASKLLEEEKRIIEAQAGTKP